MKIKAADEKYLEQAKHLTEIEAERLLSRMSGKLPRRLHKDKLSTLEALAIQLEVEDEQLNEWREKMAEIRAAELKSKEKS
jgi:hypothetical protein